MWKAAQRMTRKGRSSSGHNPPGCFRGLGVEETITKGSDPSAPGALSEALNQELDDLGRAPDDR